MTVRLTLCDFGRTMISCVYLTPVMVIPDCSLVVTTFSRHSWLLQRIATRVTSMVTFVDEEYLVSSAHLVHVPQRNRHGRFTLYVVPSSTSLRIPKDKDRRTIEQGQNWLCLKDV